MEEKSFFNGEDSFDTDFLNVYAFHFTGENRFIRNVIKLTIAFLLLRSFSIFHISHPSSPCRYTEYRVCTLFVSAQTGDSHSMGMPLSKYSMPKQSLLK